jgi:regulator of sigma E protease
MNLLFTLVSFAVTLGVLIVVHELGHYFVAKWCGVKVLRFSIGFGKPLFTRRRGPDQTEWVLAAFPLGGYVKMLDEGEGAVAPHELARAFNRQPVAKRIAVVMAGPFANLILAVALYCLLFMAGVPGVKPMLGNVPKGTAAAVAGLSSGEVLAAIEGEPVATWQDARWEILKHILKKQSVRLETGNGQGSQSRYSLDLSGLTEKDLDGDFLGKLGLVGFKPLIKPVIGQLKANGPAAQAGLMEGDAIRSVNSQSIAQWEDLVRLVRASPGKPLQFEVERGGGRRVITLVPDLVKENGETVGKVGAGPKIDERAMRDMFIEVRYAPHVALWKALHKTWDMSLFSLEMIGRMVVGQVSLKNISGPITIADYAGQSAHLGLLPFLSFLALISISLGVLNLLPVPLLDGGHLMYYMAEIIKGSPVSEKTMEIGQQIGVALLLMLMVFAFYNDINRLITS